MEKCKDCSTKRKTANNREKYLCNHFSEPCKNCEDWLNKQEYNICAECGASDSCKTVDFKEYEKIKKDKGLYEDKNNKVA